MSSAERRKAQKVLDSNAGLNFVKRILNPERYPVINNEDGSFSSHMMMDAEIDGKYFVFPTIVQERGTLKQLDPDAAIKHAIRTNELIEFPSQEEASWFARRYKAVWEK